MSPIVEAIKTKILSETIVEELKRALRDTPYLKSKVGLLRIIIRHNIMFNETVAYDSADQMLNSVFRQFSVKGNVINYNNSRLVYDVHWDDYEDYSYPYDSVLYDCVDNSQKDGVDVFELETAHLVNGLRIDIYPEDAREKMKEVLLDIHNFLFEFTNKLERESNLNMKSPVTLLNIIAQEETNNTLYSKMTEDKETHKLSSPQKIQKNETLLTLHLRDRTTITSFSNLIKNHWWSFLW